MQCPNCGNTLLADEEICPECGHDLRTNTQDAETRTRKSSSGQQKFNQIIADIRASAFFQEAIDFLKVSITKPASLVASPHSRHIKVPVIVIAALILIIALFTFIGLRVATSQISAFYGETFIPFTVFFSLIFIFIGAFAIYFVLLAFMNRLLLKESIGLQKLAHDYLALSVSVIIVWILGFISMFITLYEVGAFLFALGIAILMIIPIYIFMIHLRQENGKMDTFHSVLIYSVFAVISYLIILVLLLRQFAMNTFLGLF